ncbi:MAG: 50S ribosomal protein L22 [Phycisphaerae bacterium]|jgi:large subunit ribosomal protein L22|nr:50S ribosomal protein L22 [Phycisphaerae bacterium]
MAWSATHRHARIAPRKARLVVDMIRGMKASEALNILTYTPKRASVFVSRVLKSAVANADEDKNRDVDVEKLYIVEARVDEGPRMKRVSPKDRGRAYMICKQMSHIILVVDEK